MEVPFIAWYANALAALKHKRSNHADYIEAVRFIHEPFVAALVCTSQLTPKDWVEYCKQEVPDKTHILHRYIVQTKIWDESCVLWWAFSHDDYSHIISA